jgi:hypothetical protein
MSMYFFQFSTRILCFIIVKKHINATKNFKSTYSCCLNYILIDMVSNSMVNKEHCRKKTQGAKVSEQLEYYVFIIARGITASATSKDNFMVMLTTMVSTRRTKCANNFVGVAACQLLSPCSIWLSLCFYTNFNYLFY